MPISSDSDFEDFPPSPSSTQSSVDEDEVNRRVAPFWPKYRNILQSRGFRLDTFHDVNLFYHDYSEGQIEKPMLLNNISDHSTVCDDDLCPDAGLPDNLFRGCRNFDGRKVMVKAVHKCSRELDVIRFLSAAPTRDDPMNHCIPVLDLIEVPEEGLAFIVMEEWSSQLIPGTPCCLRYFFGALRQCIEHAVFMHKNHIAHLDISLRNLLTDYNGHYACIDYELSRRFDGISNPHIQSYRGTEIPPECEPGEFIDPYKVDVWALAVLMLRACKLTGFYVPELMQLIKPMLQENPHERPCIQSVLKDFDCMLPRIGEQRLQMSCPVSH